ncbi:MAG: DUF1648 domain-containing protein [Blastocatellia bacterium]
MQRSVNTLTAILVVLGWWRSFAAYPLLPRRIPIHFNILGRPDGWGARWMVWLLPLLTSIMAILWLAGLVGRHNIRLTPASSLPSSLLLLVVVGGLLYINERIVDCAKGEAEGLGLVFLPVFLLLASGLSIWLSMTGAGK